MSYQTKYEYNEELNKDMLHLLHFSIYTMKRFSDIIIIHMKGVNMGGKITTILDMLMTLHY